MQYGGSDILKEESYETEICLLYRIVLKEVLLHYERALSMKKCFPVPGELKLSVVASLRNNKRLFL